MQTNSRVQRRGSVFGVAARCNPRHRVDHVICITTGGAVERGSCTVGEIHLRVGEFTGCLEEKEQRSKVITDCFSVNSNLKLLFYFVAL